MYIRLYNIFNILNTFRINFKSSQIMEEELGPASFTLIYLTLVFDYDLVRIRNLLVDIYLYLILFIFLLFVFLGDEFTSTNATLWERSQRRAQSKEFSIDTSISLSYFLDFVILLLLFKILFLGRGN